MKTLALSLTLVSLALLSGCASAPPPAKAPRVAAAEEEEQVVIPFDTGAPGEMEMSWTPPPPPPQKEVKARHEAQPQWASAKKRPLFMLPSK
jgi:hypothetical protein